MKLLNHTLLYLSITLLVIIGLWATLFYFNILDEVYDSIDDGLENYKVLIIQEALTDTSVLKKNEFAESNYAIREIPASALQTQKDVFKDTLMYMQSEGESEPVRMLITGFSMPHGKTYELRVISSMVEEDDLIEDLFYSLLTLYGVLLVSLLIINNFLLKSIWKPFYKLIDRLKGFKLGTAPGAPPVTTRITEFRTLNKAITELLERNTETYNSQKQFIENAAHELQTPLAISINKLELLAETENLPPDTMETLGEVIANLERLTRLNRSLLLLSRIENRQYAKEETIGINALVKNQIEDFADFAGFKEIQMHYQEEGNLSFVMNRELADALFVNLIKNSIIHNVPKGKIDITINNNAVIISNTAQSGPLNPSHIFSRFYKQSTEKNSTGLGLAIVKQIADLYGIKISYSFDGRHHMQLHFLEHR